MIHRHRGPSRPNTPADIQDCIRFLALVIVGVLLLFWLTGCTAHAADLQIKVRVDGDTVVLVVRSTVRFTVWSSVNPSAIWWPVYTSPAPAAGSEIVWVSVGNKAGVFPDWCFWRVTPEKGLR